MNYPFDKTVNTKRLSSDAPADTETFGTNLVGIKCNIQRLEESFGQDLEGSYGKDFVMFCGIQDILQGDKIIDGSDTYLVKGVSEYDFQGYEYMELVIRKE